ncbi:FHA domain-containing protein [Halalkalibacter kiskunsagensis]|uniref:FHA domain-containing protein n=1 Tax=Halalkalibacter kiskunsagensis TaxID=1548599 RepID=A0ABV6K980_9BACI
MNVPAYLLVEQGTPFEEGAMIPLKKREVILGRTSNEWMPDVSFQNIYVSRKHASIYTEKGLFYVKDAGSKHGTFVNHERLLPNKETVLRNGDKLALANNLILLSFSTSNLEATFDVAPMMRDLVKRERKDVQLDPFQQEVIVQNRRYVFSEKEYKCIELLIQNEQQFVSKEEVKEYVWSERIHCDEQPPDVSAEEVNALIYRIRKKTDEVVSIKSIRGKGYILSLEDDGINKKSSLA